MISILKTMAITSLSVIIALVIYKKIEEMRMKKIAQNKALANLPTLSNSSGVLENDVEPEVPMARMV